MRAALLASAVACAHRNAPIMNPMPNESTPTSEPNVECLFPDQSPSQVPRVSAYTADNDGISLILSSVPEGTEPAWSVWSCTDVSAGRARTIEDLWLVEFVADISEERRYSLCDGQVAVRIPWLRLSSDWRAWSVENAGWSSQRPVVRCIPVVYLKPVGGGIDGVIMDTNMLGFLISEQLP